MKKWKKYETYLLSGDWHVHTNYTDGKNTIFEYCEQAQRNGLELIAFTEHVRKKPDYDFDNFISDVFSAKDRFDLEVLGGCEARVLDIYGNLNASEDVLRTCEIVLGAFHSFDPPQKGSYLTALLNMITHPDVDIWAHPTQFAIRNKIFLSEEDYHRIAMYCFDNDVLIEKNKKYNVPDENLLTIASKLKCKFSRGSDAHEISELLKD